MNNHTNPQALRGLGIILRKNIRCKGTCGFLENAAFQSRPDNPLDPPPLATGGYFTVQEGGKTCKGKKKIAGQFKVHEKSCNRYKK